MNTILYFFTQALSLAISLLRVDVSSVLPNLYLINRRDDDLDLVYSGDYPNLFPHAYGQYLDDIGYMFGVPRISNEPDGAYRQRILFSLSQNSTPSGIRNALNFLLRARGFESKVMVVNNFDNFFDAESTSFDYPLRDYRGSLLYSINIFVEPSEIEQLFIFSDPDDADSTRIITDDDGNPETSLFGDFIKVRLLNNEAFEKYEPVYYTYFEKAFNVDSFQLLMDDISAAGIRVESVTFLEPGAGGAKGESYAYTN